MKTKLFFLVLVCWGISLKSQNIHNVVVQDSVKKAQLFKTPTSEEEYNYMSKGYKNTISEGADLKKGYMVNNNYGKLSIGLYDFKFIPFYRGDSSFVGIIVKAHSGASNSDYWFGIPFKNIELFHNFCNQLAALDVNMTNAFINAFVMFSREKVSQPTTEIEYNYMINGYKNHITDGSDFKKGYKINERKTRIVNFKNNMSNYEFTFLPFMRDDNSCAGTIVRIKSDGSWSGGTYYYGISNSKGELLDRFFNEKSKQGPRVLSSFLQAIIQYTMED